jgi:hypothetical protein
VDPLPEPELTGDALAARLRDLGRALHHGAPLWRTRPWQQRRLDWEDELPALSAWCRGLSDDALYRLEQDPFLADAPAPWPALARDLAPLLEVGPLPRAPVDPPDPRRIPARKARQIAALAEVGATLPDGEIIEWCAGVGHLGRHLAAARGQPAVLVERDPSLCRDPYDTPPMRPVRHLTADAFDPATPARLPTGAVWVGLHACGSLTDRLLDAATARDAAAVLAAPCCLHRLHHADAYAPRSSIGRADDPHLHHLDLRMATREAVHAGARRTRLRSNELHRRTAWDLWRREATGVDAHHALPLLPRGTFDLELGVFLREQAAAQGVDGHPADLTGLSRAAEARVREIRALELPRLLFRRAIELWVAADRAQSLADQGWTARLGTFCAADATPRNLAIAASGRTAAAAV